MTRSDMPRNATRTGGAGNGADHRNARQQELAQVIVELMISVAVVGTVALLILLQLGGR